VDNVTLFSPLVILFSSKAFLHVAICQPDPVSEKEPPNQYPLEIKESASDGITYSSIPGGSTVRCKYFNSILSAPNVHLFPTTFNLCCLTMICQPYPVSENKSEPVLV